MRLFFHIILLILLIVINSESFSADGDYNATYAKVLISKANALILDVRTKEEFNEKHIPGAKLIPISELADKLEQVKLLVGKDMNRPIIVYCAAGVRAARAQKILIENGHKKVVNLGGVDAYFGDKGQ